MSARVLLIDNYDSFVFNLSRYLQELGVETEVRRNNEVSVEEISADQPAAILLSPGPRTPQEAGICGKVIRQLGPTIPILGVCLGHQSIGAAYGGKVIRAKVPVHGRTSMITHDGTGPFQGCPHPLRVTRYHSLIVESASLPECLRVTARTASGTIMALAHRDWPVFGVQFHPESILTQQGHLLLANFLNLAGLSITLPAPTGDLPEETLMEDDFYRRAIDPAVFRPM